jgi:hypothetical protein
MTDKYHKSGIYDLKFDECPLKCIGQTAQIFKV